MEAILSQLPIWLTILMVGATLLRLALGVIGFAVFGRRAPIKSQSTRTTGIWIMSAMLTVWVVLALYLGSIDYFRVDQTTVPPPAIAIAASLPILIGLGVFFLWDTFRRVIFSIPLHWMIGAQFLRVTGGAFLVMYAQGLMPGEFGILAGVGDLVTGILAIPIAYLCFRQASGWRRAVTLWNYVGIAELLLLVPLGILTSPVSFQLLAHDAPNYLTTNWPLVLAPTFHVPIGILMHLYTFAMLKRAGQMSDVVRPTNGPSVPTVQEYSG